MSTQDFIRAAAPPPEWLRQAWTGSRRRGLHALTPDDINAEIDAHRQKTKPASGDAVGPERRL